MKIIVKNLQKKISINPAQIIKAVKIACEHQQPRQEELAFYFVPNSFIQRLNKQFFDKNCLTDVISFTLDRNQAEVYIALEVVRENAHEYGQEFTQELLRCVIHGVLHILGYTDTTSKQKKKMWLRQEQLLKYV